MEKKRLKSFQKKKENCAGLEPTLDAALIQMRTISNLTELIDIAFCMCLFMKTPRIASQGDSSGGASDCDSFVRAEAYDRNKLLYCRPDFMISTSVIRKLKPIPRCAPLWIIYLFTTLWFINLFYVTSMPKNLHSP